MADGPDLSLLRQRIREIERRVVHGGGVLPGAGLEARVAELEREVGEIGAMLARLEPMIARIDATVPGAATRAEVERLRAQVAAHLAEKPSKAYLWVLLLVLAVLVVFAPRVAAAVPHGHCKTSTVVAGLRADAIGAPMMPDGAVNGLSVRA